MLVSLLSTPICTLRLRQARGDELERHVKCLHALPREIECWPHPAGHIHKYRILAANPTMFRSNKPPFGIANPTGVCGVLIPEADFNVRYFDLINVDRQKKSISFVCISITPIKKQLYTRNSLDDICAGVGAIWMDLLTGIEGHKIVRDELGIQVQENPSGYAANLVFFSAGSTKQDAPEVELANEAWYKPQPHATEPLPWTRKNVYIVGYHALAAAGVQFGFTLTPTYGTKMKLKLKKKSLLVDDPNDALHWLLQHGNEKQLSKCIVRVGSVTAKRFVATRSQQPGASNEVLVAMLKEIM
eukprot:TRINITY_DN5865_c0_g1_i3.p1 TRINITY_DN5865_c0_g1~~TRINITY_DN5865_c0_g1_i3.p1  ORF type:complete len:301 (-),score=30.88 TRINITY_DN5865_c0_g1_i3:390-1292(-)